MGTHQTERNMASTTTIQAQTHVSDFDIPLDTMSSGLARTKVDFALRYHVAADVSQLSAAFAKILPSFQALAGRIVKTETALVIRCNNAGVPLSHETRAGAAPAFDQPVPEDMFDLAAGCFPTDTQPMGEAPLRIRVTDFDNGQVIAISLNHGVCDASGIGLFMGAWAEAFQGGDGIRDISNDRVGSEVPMPGYGQPPLTSSEGIPEVWKELRHPPETAPKMPPKAPLEAPQFVAAARSANCLAKMKEQCKQLWGEAEGQEPPAMLSSNDVISAHLVESMGIECESFPLSMIMEYRGLVGAPTLFGNVWMPLELAVKNNMAAGGDIRKLLPDARSKEFVTWSLGQGHNISWPAKLFLNSWVKALKLSQLGFAGPAEDIMLGLPMLKERAMMAQMGIAYCITLPQVDGVKVVGVLPEVAAVHLAASEGGASFVSVN